MQWWQEYKAFLQELLPERYRGWVASSTFDKVVLAAVVLALAELAVVLLLWDQLASFLGWD